MSRLTLELGYDCNEVLMRQRLARLRDEGLADLGGQAHRGEIFEARPAPRPVGG